MRNLYFKSLCIFLTLGILQMQVSCTSYRQISYTKLSDLSSRRDYLLLETPKGEYGLYNFYLKGDTLKGELFKTLGTDSKCLRVYTQLLVDFNPSSYAANYLKLNVNDITKVEFRKIDLIKNVGLVVGILLGFGIYFNEAMKQDFNFNGSNMGWSGW